jgi:hypothetical protein
MRLTVPSRGDSSFLPTVVATYAPPEPHQPAALPASRLGYRGVAAWTSCCYSGDAIPQVPGGMAAIYRDLAADDDRARQVTADVAAAMVNDRHCLVLTQWWPISTSSSRRCSIGL